MNSFWSEGKVNYERRCQLSDLVSRQLDLADASIGLPHNPFGPQIGLGKTVEVISLPLLSFFETPICGCRKALDILISADCITLFEVTIRGFYHLFELVGEFGEVGFFSHAFREQRVQGICGLCDRFFKSPDYIGVARFKEYRAKRPDSPRQMTPTRDILQMAQILVISTLQVF